MAAYYKYKNKVTDDLEDAYEIVRNVGKSLQENKTDMQSVLANLAHALKKLESAKYYIDRE
jgi:chaperonin cofactor prefoldin